MRRVQSLEFNNNSYSSLSHQNKKVSLPPINEANFVPKSSYGWLHRSAPNINGRNTVVPITIGQEEVPDYFGSTMQSMCLAFFTLAYTELIDGAVFSGKSMLIHACLKFFTILCIALTLVAAFSSIRVFLFACQNSENHFKHLEIDTSKVYSTLARFGAMIAALICAMIICIFAGISLYVTLIGRTI